MIFCNEGGADRPGVRCSGDGWRVEASSTSSSSHFCDDFLIVGDTQAATSEGMAAFEALLEELHSASVPLPRSRRLGSRFATESEARPFVV